MPNRIPNIKKCPIGVVTLIACAIATFAWACPGLDRTNALYQGSIRGDLPVFMTLHITGTSVSGSYYNTNTGSTISLDGEIGEDGAFVLHETVDKRKTGQFRGTFKDDGKTLTGIWQATDKPEESPFAARMIARYVSEDSTGDIAGIPLTTSLQYPLFLDSGHPRAKYLTEAIVKEVCGAYQAFMVGSVSSYVADQPPEFLHPSIKYWFTLYDFVPSFIGENVASISYVEQVYTGGAHDTYNRRVINLLMQSKGEMRTLSLSDFIAGSAGVEKLSGLVLADLKIQRASNVEAGTITSFGEKELSVFVVTAKGIRIYFNPYAVGYFAQGIFEVFIPWAELGELANTELLLE